MKALLPFLFFCFFLLWYDESYAYVSAEEILKKCDHIITPQMDFGVKVRIICHRENKKDKQSFYEVLMKGHDKTIIKVLSPAIDKGNVLLMLRYDMWVFQPNISKPMRISLAQKLHGDVSHADISRTCFSEDYYAEIIENTDNSVYLLSLIAKNSRVTYRKIELFVDKKTNYPVKATYFNEGKAVKNSYYTRFKKILGKIRPTIIIIDSNSKISRSIIYLYDYEKENFQDKIFTKSYMKKFKF